MKISSNITGHTCTFNDGSFIFKSGKKKCKTNIGNSLENNYGGIGGFAGAQHEYFIYCGTKYEEIAIARFRKKQNLWENTKGGYQGDGEDEMFDEIWSSKANPDTVYIKVVEDRASLIPFIRIHLSSLEFCGIILSSSLSYGNLSEVDENQLFAGGMQVEVLEDLSTILELFLRLTYQTKLKVSGWNRERNT